MSENINVTIPAAKGIQLEIHRSQGTGNYNALTNKPSINGCTLIGNKTCDDIRVQSPMRALTTQEIEKILYLD